MIDRFILWMWDGAWIGVSLAVVVVALIAGIVASGLYAEGRTDRMRMAGYEKECVQDGLWPTRVGNQTILLPTHRCAWVNADGATVGIKWTSEWVEGKRVTQPRAGMHASE